MSFSELSSLESVRVQFASVRDQIGRAVVGQDRLVRNALVALLTGGHMIVEGVPGLGKTRLVNALAHTLRLQSARISFTPDLLPSDLTGGQLYNQSESRFYVKKWPIFTNLLLADEINRAPAKVQSALLEAMAERQVTIAEVTLPLPSPFLVIATQNPIEEEGTYPLPEAQLDRFLFKTLVSYPTRVEEREIITRSSVRVEDLTAVLSQSELITAMHLVADGIHVDESIYGYILDIVEATRGRGGRGVYDTRSLVRVGASPRASIAFLHAVRAIACLAGRDFVIPEDVKDIAPDILRHRLILSFEALGQGTTADDIIERILGSVRVP